MHQQEVIALLCYAAVDQSCDGVIAVVTTTAIAAAGSERIHIHTNTHSHLYHIRDAASLPHFLRRL